MSVQKAFTASLVLLSLGGCAKVGDIDVTGGIVAARSACPMVGIPNYTGDITLFNPPESREARAIDIVANITNLRSTCDDSGAQIYTQATFDVLARRSDPTGARDVTLPYFATVMRGGTAVVSKRVGQVTVHFEDGQYRASASDSAQSYVDKGQATLPADIQERITRKRKAGDSDAAVDPMADPAVRAALQRTSFELLVGFNLTQDQLKYNVTR
ncbi:hypothetical protein [Rhizorhapis sp. SPR117]|uniref:hypothetical protein n=1 Tax=Rhizorhapis sp. SPR117 TaxID=2912611 RepID=UPI001F169ECE|nr:hypothetical protein [Rhizorhapis sp. SPR117]